MKNFAIVVLVLAGLGFLGFGLWLVVDPAGGLATVDIAATSPAGLIELRGFYGGLELGLGVFFLMCAARASCLKTCCARPTADSPPQKRWVIVSLC